MQHYALFRFQEGKYLEGVVHYLTRCCMCLLTYYIWHKKAAYVGDILRPLGYLNGANIRRFLESCKKSP